MAVKKYRPGQVVDLGVESQETPLDKMLKLMQVSSSIGAGVQQIKERRDNNVINAMDVINKISLDSPTDASMKKRLLSNMPKTNNPFLNTASEVMGNQIDSEITSFERLQTKGDEIAGILNRKNTWRDNEGIRKEGMYDTMSKEDWVEYFTFSNPPKDSGKRTPGVWREDVEDLGLNLWQSIAEDLLKLIVLHQMRGDDLGFLRQVNLLKNLI